MNHYGPESLLKSQPALWDGACEELPVSAGDIKESCEALDRTLREIDSYAGVRNERVSLWEDTNSQHLFRGWIVASELDGDTDLVIAKAMRPDKCGYLLIAKEYCNQQITDNKRSAVRAGPYIAHSFAFTETAGGSYAGLQSARMENVPTLVTLQEPTAGNRPESDNFEEAFESIVSDEGRFTMYGLYKANEYLASLRQGASLA